MANFVFLKTINYKLQGIKWTVDSGVWSMDKMNKFRSGNCVIKSNLFLRGINFCHLLNKISCAKYVYSLNFSFPISPLYTGNYIF